MTLDYFVKRLLQFFVIAFLAATINFFFPRMSGQDPIQTETGPTSEPGCQRVQ